MYLVITLFPPLSGVGNSCSIRDKILQAPMLGTGHEFNENSTLERQRRKSYKLLISWPQHLC